MMVMEGERLQGKKAFGGRKVEGEVGVSDASEMTVGVGSSDVVS